MTASLNNSHIIYETASESVMYKVFKDYLIPYQSLVLGDLLGQGK